MPDINAFKRDANRIPDVDRTRGRSVSYEDTSFIAGDSPVVLDFNTDAGRNGRDGYIIVDGSGDIKIEVSNDGTTFGGLYVAKQNEIFRLKGMDIDSIRLTWVSNSSYRVLVV